MAKEKRVRIAEEEATTMGQPLLLPPSPSTAIAMATPFRAASQPSSEEQQQQQQEEEQPPRPAGGVLRDKWGRYRTLYDQRARTVLAINAASVLERSNEQILPSLYKYVGKSFHTGPRQLGLITLACALVQAVASPAGGLLGHYYNRVNVLSSGCFIWGTFCLLFAASHSVMEGVLIWAFNGIGLALLIPNAQSLVADYFKEGSRGKAFGALYLTGALGGMLGALGATNLGHLTPWGYEGWRAAFIIVAALSIIVGILNLIASVDPRYKLEEAEDVAAYSQERDLLKEEEGASVHRILNDVVSVLAVPSFIIVVIQGIVGSAPWNALVFNTLYLQLLGMTDFQASLVAALFMLGTAIGAVIGGVIGDWSAERSPHHGRIFTAQFSVGMGVPLSIFIYKMLPMLSSSLYVYGACFFGWGAIISWAASACTSPLFSEIVPSQLTSIVFSFDRAFEGAIAATGAPVVGWLAERMGFSPDDDDNDDGGGSGGTASPAERDIERARALGTAMLICTALPWAICAFFFSGLHITYRRDKAAARLYQRARSGVTLTSQLVPQMTVGHAISSGFLPAEISTAPSQSPLYSPVARSVQEGPASPQSPLSP